MDAPATDSLEGLAPEEISSRVGAITIQAIVLVERLANITGNSELQALLIKLRAELTRICERAHVLDLAPATIRLGRVLIVDDDPLTRRAFARVLDTVYAVATASCGAEALHFLDAGERFDAVVCDLTTSDMSNTELYDEVRQRSPALASRMMIVTGRPLAAEDVPGSTASDPVHKPVDAKTLRAAVARLVY